MLAVGVNKEDVRWLESMYGSPALHLPANRARIEQIFVDAYTRILQSATPEFFVKQTLN